MKSKKHQTSRRFTAQHLLLTILSVCAAIAIPSIAFGNYEVDLLLILLLAANIIFLTISLLNKRILLATLNATFLFLYLYPYFLQQKIGFRFIYLDDANASISSYTFVAVLLFLSPLNFFALKSKRRSFPGGMMPQTPKKRIMVASYSVQVHDIFWLGVFFVHAALYVLLFGVSEILASRFDQIIDEGYLKTGQANFLSGILKILPFWMVNRMLTQRIASGQGMFSFSVIIVFAGAFIISNPGNTARFLSLAAIAVALFPVVLRYNLLSWLPAMLPAALVALPFTSALRFGLISRSERAVENISQSFIDSLKTLEFSSMQILNDGFIYANDLSGWFGKHTISAIFIFVPRSVWPGKNSGTGVAVAEISGYPFTNIGISPIFDVYLDFGFLGIIIFGIFSGVILSKLEINLKITQADYRNLSPLLICYLGLLPIFLRGDAGIFMITVYSFAISYILVRFLEKIRLAFRR